MHLLRLAQREARGAREGTQGTRRVRPTGTSVEEPGSSSLSGQVWNISSQCRFLPCRLCSEPRGPGHSASQAVGPAWCAGRAAAGGPRGQALPPRGFCSVLCELVVCVVRETGRGRGRDECPGLVWEPPEERQPVLWAAAGGGLEWAASLPGWGSAPGRVSRDRPRWQAGAGTEEGTRGPSAESPGHRCAAERCPAVEREALTPTWSGRGQGWGRCLRSAGPPGGGSPPHPVGASRSRAPPPQRGRGGLSPAPITGERSVGLCVFRTQEGTLVLLHYPSETLLVSVMGEGLS